MRRHTPLLISLWTALLLACHVQAGDELSQQFAAPPDSARIWTWWFWLDDHVDAASITADLEELKAKGIGGVTIYSLAALPVPPNAAWASCLANPPGPDFLSPAWRELFQHAVKEANRLGLGVSMILCSGWNVGGPWITPEHACKQYVHSELVLQGPQRFQGRLPQPPAKHGFYREVAVQAFPITSPKPLVTAGSSDPGEPVRREAPLWAFKGVRDGFSHIDTPIAEICAVPLKPLPPQEDATAIDPARIVDLTARCAADGTLLWDVPPGRWLVLRTGCAAIGTKTNQSSASGAGLEADPLDPAAMEIQFQHVAVPLLAAAKGLVPQVFRSVQIDSWENGLPNWSGNFVEQFQKYRGYDPRPYLPALADWTIGSAEITDRFLYDYRNTLGDCVAEHYFGRLTTLAEAQGIVQQSEAGGVCSPKVMAMDCLKNLGRCAVPMGEFWANDAYVEAGQNTNGKQTASAAHLYGKRIAAAEAFTTMGNWVESPATLKPLADRAFCEGLNQFFMFSSATHSGDGFPGTEYYAGTYFNRKITWWQHARSFTDYLARCQHLLQQGHFVADVLYYNGDGCPNYVSPKHVDPGLGPGYDYDVCNTEILLTRLSVKDGRIVLPDGMSYRLLVLPERKTMPVEVVRRLKELVAAGMTLVGPKPEKAPGLKDYPRCDEEVQSLAGELWGTSDGKTVTEHPFGRGRVCWGTSIRGILDKAGVPPDFCYSDGQPDTLVDWIHRSAGASEIYFLVNRNDRWEHVTATFRVHGRQPEIWDPVSGRTRDAAAFSGSADATSLALEFAPYGSVFVVFRHPAAAETVAPAGEHFPAAVPAMEIAGPWTVKFDPQWGGPESVVFEQLTDWTRRPEEGIKFYSGTATYSARFDLGKPGIGAGTRLLLDLGDVRNIAAVRLNGQPLGTVWTAPFRVEITGLVRPADNQLEIAVTNLWSNRVSLDDTLPDEKRLTRTNIRAVKKNPPLLSSGLLGPVKILAGKGEDR